MSYKFFIFQEKKKRKSETKIQNQNVSRSQEIENIEGYDEERKKKKSETFFCHFL